MNINNNYVLTFVCPAILLGLTGCDEKIIDKTKTVVQKAEPAVLYTAPKFQSASVTDLNSQQAQVNGDGSFSFTIPELTYPVTFSNLVPADSQQSVSVQLRTSKGDVASAVTTFLTRFPVADYDSILGRLSDSTGIEAERLTGNFDSDNDVETAKVSRVLYYIDALNLEFSFDDYFLDSPSNQAFFETIKKFIESELNRSINASLARNYYFTKHLENIVKSVEQFQPYSRSNSKQNDELVSFYESMQKYRYNEFNGILNNVGADFFTDVISQGTANYSDIFDVVEQYLEVVDNHNANYTLDEIKNLNKSELNTEALDSSEGAVYVALFNQALNLDVPRTTFYTPEQVLTSVIRLYQLFAEGKEYHKPDLIEDVEFLLGISLTETGVEAIKQQLSTIDSTTWTIDDYLNYIVLNNIANQPLNYTLDSQLLSDFLVESNINKGTGAVIGAEVAYVTAKAINEWSLDTSHWTLKFLGEHADFFTSTWDEDNERYIVSLTKNVAQVSTPILELSFDSTWSRYGENTEVLRQNHTINVQQDRTFFAPTKVSFRPANPSIDNDPGNQLYVYFNKAIKPESLSNIGLELSDTNITVGTFTIDPNNDKVLIAELSGDVTGVEVEVLERDKGTIFAYEQRSEGAESEIGTDGLRRPEGFDESLYNKDNVLELVKVTGAQGLNDDGSDVAVDETISVAASTLRYRGIDYQLTRSPSTGRIYFAQNLGATTKCDDNSTTMQTTLPTCRGNYYQYGRVNDGHEIFNHPTLPDSSLELEARAEEVDFATFGWDPQTAKYLRIIKPQKTDYLWNTADHTSLHRNSPLKDTVQGIYCPVGYRVPDRDEYISEFKYNKGMIQRGVLNSFSESFLYVGAPGWRDQNGELGNVDWMVWITYGKDWDNNFLRKTWGVRKNMTEFIEASWDFGTYYRSLGGFTMRCMKDY